MMVMDTTSNLLNRNADISDCCILAPFARLGIRTEMVDGSLMLSRITYLPPLASLKAPENDLAALVAKQCQAYFLDPTAVFDLPLKPVGTEFQQRVWHAIAQMQSGEKTTYGAIAAHLHSGARAVGGACGANYFPLVIPCHRVVAKANLGGFMGQDAPGLYRDIKLWLLNHEARA
jgi:methylated-DNA-[protein]-cysteine S-methyltransferase